MIRQLKIRNNKNVNESQSQEIGNYYNRFSKKYNIDLDELVYGEDGFMKSCYPNGFPDFAGDVIYSEKYWNEFEKWLKDTKGIELTEGKDKSCNEAREPIKKFKDKDALEKWLEKYDGAFYNRDDNRIETGSYKEWEAIAKELGIDSAHMFGNWADGYVIDLNDYMNESLNEDTIEGPYYIVYDIPNSVMQSDIFYNKEGFKGNYDRDYHFVEFENATEYNTKAEARKDLKQAKEAYASEAKFWNGEKSKFWSSRKDPEGLDLDSVRFYILNKDELYDVLGIELEDEEEEYNAKHAEEWMEKHPYGWYNNENDYGTGDEEDEEEDFDESLNESNSIDNKKFIDMLNRRYSKYLNDGDYDEIVDRLMNAKKDDRHGMSAALCELHPEWLEHLERWMWKKCFEDNVYLESITIPGTIKKIPYLPFTNEYGANHTLKEVTILDGVEEIGEKAFYRCEALKSITIPGSVKKIDRMAFCDCEELETAIIKEGVSNTGDAIFENCFKLKNVSLPSTLRTIGQVAFYGCRSLDAITIPDGVIEIGYLAFANSGLRDTVTIPNTVKEIDGGAFYGCHISKLVIPESVTEMSNPLYDRWADKEETSGSVTIYTKNQYVIDCCKEWNTWDRDIDIKYVNLNKANKEGKVKTYYKENATENLNEDIEDDIADDRIFDFDNEDDCETIGAYLYDEGIFPDELEYEEGEGITAPMGCIPATQYCPADYEYEGDVAWNYSLEDKDYQEIADLLKEFIDKDEKYKDKDFTGKDLKEINSDAFYKFLKDKFYHDAAQDAWDNYEEPEYDGWYDESLNEENNMKSEKMYIVFDHNDEPGITHIFTESGLNRTWLSGDNEDIVIEEITPIQPGKKSLIGNDDESVYEYLANVTDEEWIQLLKDAYKEALKQIEEYGEAEEVGPLALYYSDDDSISQRDLASEEAFIKGYNQAIEESYVDGDSQEQWCWYTYDDVDADVDSFLPDEEDDEEDDEEENNYKKNNMKNDNLIYMAFDTDQWNMTARLKELSDDPGYPIELVGAYKVTGNFKHPFYNYLIRGTREALESFLANAIRIIGMPGDRITYTMDADPNNEEDWYPQGGENLLESLEKSTKAISIEEALRELSKEE